MNPEELDLTIGARIAEARSIVIISHVRPDGDAVGSLLGLGIALLNAGKIVQLVLEDGLPDKYATLKFANQVVRKISGEFDLSIIVDSSDPERIGSVLSNYPKPDIVIDHHKTNLRFAHLNLVEEDEVATAAVLAKHMPNWGLIIDQDVAAALLTGIIADTIGFRTSNMTPQALRISADLMEKGADLVALYRQALVSRPFEAMRYWGAGLNRLQRDEGIIWTTLTLDDKISSNYQDNDDADLINVLSAIEDVEIALIFVEQINNIVKVSWRSNGKIDVSEIAFEFGGGGHKAAAGAEIQGELAHVLDSVLRASKKLRAKTKSN